YRVPEIEEANIAQTDIRYRVPEIEEASIAQTNIRYRVPEIEEANIAQTDIRYRVPEIEEASIAQTDIRYRVPQIEEASIDQTEQSQFALLYKEEDRAWAGLQMLKRLDQLGYIKLKRAIVAACRENGQLISEEESKLNLIRPKYGLAGLAGTIAGLIGTAPSGPGALLAGAFWGAFGTTASMSYDAKKQRDVRGTFYEEVEDRLTPNSSAIVIQAEILDPDQVVKALVKLGRGEVIQESLDAHLYSELKEAVKKA
ncbi:MAG: DUF1269 domain-containing protein, partial [Chloroflexi bacterium]|nr:DUF1269 domain-containing protein [Chloroflexota bacterium]